MEFERIKCGLEPVVEHFGFDLLVLALRGQPRILDLRCSEMLGLKRSFSGSQESNFKPKRAVVQVTAALPTSAKWPPLAMERKCAQRASLASELRSSPQRCSRCASSSRCNERCRRHQADCQGSAHSHHLWMKLTFCFHPKMQKQLLSSIKR